MRDRHRDAGGLQVHLERRDAFLGPGDLEVHVAVGVLGAQDVGQDRDLALLLDEAHRDARDRRLDRDARVHHREAAAADRRHRRRAVRLEDVADQADRVGELVGAGDDGFERPLGERAVADLAAAGAADGLHFADREVREVVVQHEAERVFLVQALDDLLVARGAQRGA